MWYNHSNKSNANQRKNNTSIFHHPSIHQLINTMKFSLSFLTTALLFPFSEAIDLQARWAIGNVVATNDKNDFTLQYPNLDKGFLGPTATDKIRATIYGSNCKVDDTTAWYAASGYEPTGTTAVTEADAGEFAFTTPSDALVWSSTTTKATVNDTADTVIGFSTDTTKDLEGHFSVPDDYTTVGAGTISIVSDDTLLQFDFTTVPKVMAKLDDITTSNAELNESSMKFCVRVGLYAITPATAEDVAVSNEINFQETEVVLTVTMDGNFEITSFGVAPKEKTSDSAAQTYTVLAALCDVDEAASTYTFNQGAAINVCITPDQKAKDDGVEIMTVDSFTWQRTYTIADVPAGVTDIPAATEQIAIASANLVSGDGLTVLNKDNPKEFVVTSVLFAAFYATNGKVSAAGAATMAFPQTTAGVRRTRSLRDSDSDNKRNLQEGGGTTVAPFDMTATLNKADDGPVSLQQTAGGDKVVGTSITVVTTIAGLVSAILLA